MVVVRADEHVLVGEVGARDHRHHVRAVGELLRIRSVAGAGRVRTVRDRLQLVDQVLPSQGGSGSAVVSALGRVARELEHVHVRAPGKRDRE
jgi:hypothetical protein